MHILKYLLILLVFSLDLIADQKLIAIYEHPPIADPECVLALKKVLQVQYRVKILHHQTLVSENLKDVDCIAFPGGLENIDNFNILLKDKKELIQQFVNFGGAYLGICMGAYLADEEYFDLLKDIRVKQYILTNKADWWSEKEITVLPVTWYRYNYHMYFYDGPAFVGDLSNVKKIATYSNKRAMAIIQGKIGLIGCHPESQLDWYNGKLRRFWHKEEHHRLLLNFVDILLN